MTLNVFAAIHSHHCSRYDLTSHQVAMALKTATEASRSDIGFSLNPASDRMLMPHVRARIPAMAMIPLTATTGHVRRVRCMLPLLSSGSLSLSLPHCHSPMKAVTR